MATEAIAVNVENFPRAESDMYFASVAGLGGFATLFHHREPMPIEHQTVARANRDTLYSAVVLDLEAGPATVTLPDAGERFVSLIMINEDHYVVGVEYGVGTYPVLRSTTGTRYVLVAVSTLLNPGVEGDLEAVHALQDAMTVEQPGGPGVLDLPAGARRAGPVAAH